MTGGPRIAIDAMGGDTGPAAMISGAAKARRKDPELNFAFYGDERLIRAELGHHPNLRNGFTIVHSDEAIDATEKPSQACNIEPDVPGYGGHGHHDRCHVEQDQEAAQAQSQRRREGLALPDDVV